MDEVTKWQLEQMRLQSRINAKVGIKQTHGKTFSDYQGKDRIKFILNELATKDIKLQGQGLSKIQATTELLIKIISNIRNSPEEVKFRTLKKSNGTISEKIAKYKNCNFLLI